jgi:hypothetical protein
MTTARTRPDRRVDILALRVTADLLAVADEADPEIDILGTDLTEAIWETALDTESLDLDLFDPNVQAELTDRVKGLLAHLAS